MAGSSRKKRKPRGENPAVAVAVNSTPGWLAGLVLFLAVAIVYSPVMWAGFVWDDSLLVTTNPAMIGLRGLREIWTTSAADICPFTLTTFWIEHALWGFAPLPYHLITVFLHGTCAILLWRLLLRLHVPGAWFGAALWSLHPVMVQSVAWITEMKNTESGAFFLLAILFFVKDLRVTPNSNQRGRHLNYILTLLFSALAMASKSSTVVLPVVLCLCAWWLEGRWHWRHLARVGPILLMSVGAGLVTIWRYQIGGADDPLWMVTWPERLVTAGHAVWFYLGKLLWPHPLVFIYPRWEPNAATGLSYPPLGAVILVWLILWLNRASWPRAAFFAFSYFVVALLPVLGLVQLYFLRYSFVEDHFQYLAAMGPLAFAGAGMTRLSALLLTATQWLQWTLCAALLFILGTLSWQRAWVFESETCLWTDTLAKNPTCWVAHNNLGFILLQKGDLDGAIAHCQAALQINPNYADADNNLGIALFRKGHIDEAIALCEKALELNPDYPEAHNSLGNYLLQKGQVDEAIIHYQKALEIKPNYAEAHYNFGMALFQAGQLDQAIFHFQKFLEINPNLVAARNSLGVALFKKGRVVDAIAQFQEALRLQPDNVDVQKNLADAQAATGENSAPK